MHNCVRAEPDRVLGGQQPDSAAVPLQNRNDMLPLDEIQWSRALALNEVLAAGAKSNVQLELGSVEPQGLAAQGRNALAEADQLGLAKDR